MTAATSAPRGRTLVERLARWAVTVDAAPRPVFALARAQRRSVFAAIAAANDLPQVRRIVTTGDAMGHLDRRVLAATVPSIALDFDDYVCFGHTGHSAVPVPILLGAEAGAPGKEQVLAQIAAGEIGARLGGACLLGPLNGQLWSFVHAAVAAVAAGRLMSLGPDRTAHALALALHQAPHPTIPGFVSSDAKLLTAADPTLAGLRAARQAASGVDGPLDVLDAPDGFFAAFTDAPLRGLFGGLGRGWALHTLCVKPYPGCAYLTAAVDAVHDLDLPGPESIDRITVAGAAPSVLMENLSRPYATGRPDPVNATFSIRRTLAILLVGGDLAPERFTREWLDANAASIDDIAARTEVRHDPRLTAASAEAFMDVLPPRRVARDAGGLGLLRSLRGRGDLRRALRSAGSGGTHGAVTAPSNETGGGWAAALLRRAVRDGTYWNPAALAGFRMVLPAAVTMDLRDGRRLHRTVETPAGAAGHPDLPPTQAAHVKLAEHGPRRWGVARTATLAAAITGDDPELAAYLAD